MGPRKCGLILQVVLKYRLFNTEIFPFGTKSSGLIIKGGLKIEGCKIEGPLYTYSEENEAMKKFFFNFWGVN